VKCLSVQIANGLRAVSIRVRSGEAPVTPLFGIGGVSRSVDMHGESPWVNAPGSSGWAIGKGVPQRVLWWENTFLIGCSKGFPPQSTGHFEEKSRIWQNASVVSLTTGSTGNSRG
jgi:hypothetical protein